MSRNDTKILSIHSLKRLIRKMFVNKSFVIVKMNLLKNLNLNFKRKLSSAKAFGVDIGGTMTKVMTLSSEDENWFKNVDFEFSKISKLKFKNSNGFLLSTEFPSCNFKILSKIFESNPNQVFFTGGGSFKFKNEIKEFYCAEYKTKPELDCLTRGFIFCHDNSIIKFRGYDENLTRIYLNDKLEYPFLITNIGSGVSIVRVDDPQKFVRVSGTSTGGATFMGLCRLLTGSENFNEVLKMAEKGNNNSVDLLVKDIYGESCKDLNLDGNLIAASFGKIDNNVTKEDLARATLMMTVIDIGLLTAESALRENVKNVYFTGNFLKNNELGRKKLHSLLKYRSQDLNPTFINHQGYLGALGALLYALDS